MELKDILDEFGDCLNDSAITGNSNKEDRGNLLIVFGEFIKKLLEDCGIKDTDITFNSNKRMVDAYSKSKDTLYQFGIMLKSDSLFLDITPFIMPSLSIRNELRDKYKCNIKGRTFRKGWSLLSKPSTIYKEARQIVNSLLIAYPDQPR